MVRNRVSSGVAFRNHPQIYGSNRVSICGHALHSIFAYNYGSKTHVDSKACNRKRERKSAFLRSYFVSYRRHVALSAVTGNTLLGPPDSLGYLGVRRRQLGNVHYRVHSINPRSKPSCVSRGIPLIEDRLGEDRSQIARTRYSCLP